MLLHIFRLEAKASRSGRRKEHVAQDPRARARRVEDLMGRARGDIGSIGDRVALVEDPGGLLLREAIQEPDEGDLAPTLQCGVPQRSRLHILLFAQGPVLRREAGRDTKAELSKNFLFNCRKPARVAREGLWGALSFSELILGLIAGDTGRGVRNKAGTSSGWSAIIHDLLEITARRAYTRKIVNCTRVAAGRRGRLCLAIMNADEEKTRFGL